MTGPELTAAVAAARHAFKPIREDYAALGAYLVLSLPGGQASVDTEPRTLLTEFPGLIVDDEAKAEALRLLAKMDRAEASAQAELSACVQRLSFKPECQVELRFQHLKYELIWKLQADERVDRVLTPQTQASINIVLGTLGHFLQQVH